LVLEIIQTSETEKVWQEPHWRYTKKNNEPPTSPIRKQGFRAS
jgi:hypothetical protein